MRPFISAPILLLLLLASLASADVVTPPARAEAAAWVVTAKSPARVVIGQPAVLEISLEARAGHHLNDDYPINFRPASAAVARFDKARFDRQDGLVTVPCASEPHACGVRLPVSYMPIAAGSARLGGTLAFSVCNEEHCLIEKIDVAAAVEVARSNH